MAATANLKEFVGKWKLERSEHFDEFCKEVGMNFMIRKMAAASTPVQELEIVDDNTLKITTSTVIMTQIQNVKFDGEYKFEGQQGAQLKGKASFVDGKLIIEQTAENKPEVKPQRIQRQIIDGELVMTIHIGNVVCTRVFKKQ